MIQPQPQAKLARLAIARTSPETIFKKKAMMQSSNSCALPPVGMIKFIEVTRKSMAKWCKFSLALRGRIRGILQN